MADNTHGDTKIRPVLEDISGMTFQQGMAIADMRYTNAASELTETRTKVLVTLNAYLVLFGIIALVAAVLGLVILFGVV